MLIHRDEAMAECLAAKRPVQVNTAVMRWRQKRY
ncbi:cellulose synthase operon protein YhjQ/BcsQ [Escherichia coli]